HTLPNGKVLHFRFEAAFLLGASASNIPSAITSGAARSVVRLARRNSSNLHRYGVRWHSKALVIEKDFPLNFELLSACLEKVARALYFHHHRGQRKLFGNLKVCPLFIPVEPRVTPELALALSKVRAKTDLDFEQLPRLGPHQEIFAYQVIETPNIVAVNMEFYGAHRASVMGGVPAAARPSS
uniref:hypothetical protein n=1 Tax=Cupriavidus metallidurans TaxID=119219 RepID=UPI000493B066